MRRDTGRGEDEGAKAGATGLTRPVTPIDWLQFERANALLADSISRSGTTFDIVLAINRGGAISGVCVSHLLGIARMLTFTIQVTMSDTANAQRKQATVIGTEVFTHLTGKHVLLVDDAVGSGETLIIAKQALHSVELLSLTTAATIWNTEDHADCPADHYGGTTPGWVYFPWEDAARIYRA